MTGSTAITVRRDGRDLAIKLLTSAAAQAGWETHDTRRLLPGLAVTVEPGVYPGPFGIRSEVNVLITETGGVVTTPIQAEPYRLGE